ncbi:MAG: DNA-binding protein [Nitrospirae bacterium]|nr:DNA-binding protein [Nitrospirota bacterium]
MSVLALTVSLNGTYAGSQKSSTESTQANQDMSSLSGKVLESMDSGGYTYINIENSGKKTWVAVPKIKVTVGQDISFQPGMVMTNFQSKTLNRTFESIVFSGGVTGPQGKESVSNSADHTPPKVSTDKAIKVEKASGSDAYIVAELYEKSAALDKKNVVVRGQVVKFSPNIMGKNWIHIQDGSGDPSRGTNDILVTSQETANAGDIITVKGTLYKDKDFGSGYKYAVILEDARIKK